MERRVESLGLRLEIQWDLNIWRREDGEGKPVFMGYSRAVLAKGLGSGPGQTLGLNSDSATLKAV